MPLDELARESTIRRGGRSIRIIFQNRFAEARGLAQTYAARDDRLINAFTKMLPHVGDHLLTKVCPSVKHRHDDSGQLETLVAPESITCSISRTIFTKPSSAKYSHWIGVNSSSAAASALLIRIPSDGGQSKRTKSNVSSVCSGLSVSARRVR